MTTPRPLPRTDSPRDTAAYAAGLRHLADLIESGRAPMPTNPGIGFHAYRLATEDLDQPTAARDLMRAIGGGRYDKEQWENSLILRGMCAGVPVDIWVARDEVCERVVVGTEEITEVIPAVTEDDLRPEQTITRTVEHVEWVCQPLLSAAGSESTDSIEVGA